MGIWTSYGAPTHGIPPWNTPSGFSKQTLGLPCSQVRSPQRLDPSIPDDPSVILLRHTT